MAWIEGDDERALDILSRIATPHAVSLYRLISSPKINVLAQVRHDSSAYYSILDAIAHDPRFDVRNISFHPDDISLRPYADILELKGNWEPDFYFCHQVEYHAIPPNLGALACPILGQTADYDIHIQTALPWLRIFDALVVTNETEKRDVSRLSPAPVFTFPKIFGVDSGTIDAPARTREYDVFISGLLLHPFHPDKAELVNAVLRQKGWNVLVVNGMVSETEYNRLLARSKVCFTFVRHPGAMPSRGIEALHRGCAVVAQKESVLHEYFSEEEGVAAYDSTSGELLVQIGRILENWPEWAARAARGAARVQREFTFDRCMSQYFRFLSYLATSPEILARSTQRSMSTTRHCRTRLRHRRPLMAGGFQSAHPAALAQIHQLTFEQMQADLNHSPDTSHYISLSREMILGHACGVGDADAFARSLDLLRRGMWDDPGALAPRWLFVWCAMTWGSAAEILEALKLARSTLETSAEYWRLDPEDDLLPYDCGNRFLNHRRMIDLLMQEITAERSTRRERIDVLLASLRHLISYHDQSSANMAEAVRLDPDFPVFRLRHITLLLQQNDLNSAANKTGALIQLFRTSFLPEESYELLTRFHGLGLISDEEFETVRAEAARMRARTSFVGRRSGLPVEEHWDALHTVAIFGASASGKKCAAECRERGKAIVYFLDNAPPDGETIENLRVLLPQAAVAGLGNIDGVILASAGAKDLMFRQLRQLNYSGPIYDWKG